MIRAFAWRRHLPTSRRWHFNVNLRAALSLSFSLGSGASQISATISTVSQNFSVRSSPYLSATSATSAAQRPLRLILQLTQPLTHCWIRVSELVDISESCKMDAEDAETQRSQRSQRCVLQVASASSHVLFEGIADGSFSTSPSQFIHRKSCFPRCS